MLRTSCFYIFNFHVFMFTLKTKPTNVVVGFILQNVDVIHYFPFNGPMNPLNPH